jgi:hypothetical protein
LHDAGTIMNMTFERAFDLAAKLSKEDKEWSYTVEVNATTRKAKILVSDEDGHKLGYLGDYS